jgi:hypothetical protein
MNRQALGPYRVQELVREAGGDRPVDIGVRPGLDPVDRQEARLDPVGYVVDRVCGVVRPVHDLALDALEGVQRLSGPQAPGHPGPPEHKGAHPLLGVVKEVVARPLGELPEEGLVLEDAVQQGARRLHPAHPRALLVHGLDQQVHGLCVALEPPPAEHQLLERALARVAEGRVPEVMREADRLHQVRVDEEVVAKRALERPEELADRAADLRHLHRVREPRAVEVVLPGEEDLGLRLELAERVRVDDAVAVDLERVPVVGLAGAAEGLAVKGPVESVCHRESPATTAQRRSGTQSLLGAVLKTRFGVVLSAPGANTRAHELPHDESALQGETRGGPGLGAGPRARPGP